MSFREGGAVTEGALPRPPGGHRGSTAAGPVLEAVQDLITPLGVALYHKLKLHTLLRKNPTPLDEDMLADPIKFMSGTLPPRRGSQGGPRWPLAPCAACLASWQQRALREPRAVAASTGMGGGNAATPAPSGAHGTDAYCSCFRPLFMTVMRDPVSRGTMSRREFSPAECLAAPTPPEAFT